VGRLGLPVPARYRQPKWDKPAPRVAVRTGVPRAHLLHIGKTGGTAIKTALGPLVESGPYSLALHKHRFILDMVPDDEVFFFALRDPISRFVSGFYSRQRQGRPRYFSPWSDGERAVFERFSSANALAMALGSDHEEQRTQAETAMGALAHLGTVWQWFGDEEAFLRREPFLLKVLFTDRLDDDFAQLTEKLGLTSFHPLLPHDEKASHRAPPNPDPLGEDAIASLRRWYERDYAFFDLCRELEARRA
jgi:hypothetical protein